MTHERPYRQPMSHEEAAAVLRDGAGTQWDPTVVEKFLSLNWQTPGEPHSPAA